MEEEKKKVDKNWKDAVGREKEEVKEDKAGPTPPADFSFFVSSLSMQVLMHLGDMENPMTGKIEKNLPQAKYVIDTLAMLKDKTKGNLTEKEQDILDQILYELRMRFVARGKAGS